MRAAFASSPGTFSTKLRTRGSQFKTSAKHMCARAGRRLARPLRQYCTARQHDKNAGTQTAARRAMRGGAARRTRQSRARSWRSLPAHAKGHVTPRGPGPLPRSLPAQLQREHGVGGGGVTRLRHRAKERAHGRRELRELVDRALLRVPVEEKIAEQAPCEAWAPGCSRTLPVGPIASIFFFLLL